MGKIKNPSLALLFAAVMYRRDFDLGAVMRLLTDAYGAVDAALMFGPIEFSWSDYYRAEMGDDLLKQYFFFDAAIDRAQLSSIKIHTNEIEEKFAANGGRVVNIDPGYLTVDKLVLASTKDFFHRIYIGNGIFAEATLHYRSKIGYKHFSWTYADYQNADFLKFLESARARLLP